MVVMRTASTSSLVAGMRIISLSTAQRTAVRMASSYAPSEYSGSSSSSSSGAYGRFQVPQLPPIAPLPSRQKPPSSAYYTGRPAFIDSMLEVEEITRQCRRALELAQVLPRNSTIRDIAAASPMSNRGFSSKLWLALPDLNVRLGARLTSTQYRRIVARLGLMVRYSRLIKSLAAESAEGDSNVHVAGLLGPGGVAENFDATMSKYMSEYAKTHDLLAETDIEKEFWDAANKNVDSKGRAYARGRRKESSAQVWIIRKKPEDVESVGEILVNNLPLAEYFSRNAEREAVTWPLKLTSNLGMYNVFALARSGGKSGQAGAIAHGLARALVFETAHSMSIDQGLPLKKYVHSVLTKDGVSRRDPRMVERKKTGLAKARKAYTWVKR